jgi:hypothetical protein
LIDIFGEAKGWLGPTPVEYLGDDKRVLLVMLEYIAYEKGKAVTEVYKKT